MKKKLSPRGFTLIEIMIVIVIIGILTALAVPRFMTNTRRGKQTEAQLMLKQIYSMQRAYFMANSTYGCNGVTADGTVANRDNFSAIGVQLHANAKYNYTITVQNGGKSFTASASANIDDDPVNDVWEIDESGTLVNSTNDITT
jgi:prepilin-type N-terminal cleavage/methylation domain-containing protein